MTDETPYNPFAEMQDGEHKKAEKVEELDTMQKRIHNPLENPETRQAMFADFSTTLQKIGLSEKEAQAMCNHILASLSET